MKKIINVALILALVLNLFAICASANGEIFTFSLEADQEKIAAGETVTLTLSPSEGANVYGGVFYVTYDSNLFAKPAKNKVSAGDDVDMLQINVNTLGRIKLVLANSEWVVGTEIATIKLTAKTDVSGIANFGLEVDPDGDGISYAPSGVLVDDNGELIEGAGLTIFTGFNKSASATVQVGEIAPPAFTVTANDNGTDTVVTVANKGDKTGKVYVATFVGGVLDVCQVKDLADGTLTFEGLTGDVKVYVWDNNMVPLLDTALDA